MFGLRLHSVSPLSVATPPPINWGAGYSLQSGVTSVLGVLRGFVVLSASCLSARFRFKPCRQGLYCIAGSSARFGFRQVVEKHIGWSLHLVWANIYSPLHIFGCCVFGHPQGMFGHLQEMPLHFNSIGPKCFVG